MSLLPRKLLALASLAVAVSCASPSSLRSMAVRQTFLHGAHRQTYRLTEAEMRELDFYVSTNVLVGGVPGAERRDGAVYVDAREPGVLRAAGPDWLRVAFGSGEGLTFVASDSDRSGGYYLATELESREGWLAVKELPVRTLRYAGVDYPVVYGGEARLLVGTDGLRELLREKRAASIGAAAQ